MATATATAYRVPEGKALILRTCRADGRSPSNSARGFKWPRAGLVECADWSREPVCGKGLHGLLWGEGDGGLLNWEPDALWLVAEVDAAECVDLQGKVKFPRAIVVHAGDRKSATDFLLAHLARAASVVGATVAAGDSGTATAGYRGTATAGDSGTATAGYRGTATAGYRGTATAGDRGTATAGDSGTATAGDRGTATAGDSGTATAGDSGVLLLSYWDERNARRRVVTLYVGEDGIEPNTKYRLNETTHKPERVEEVAKATV